MRALVPFLFLSGCVAATPPSELPLIGGGYPTDGFYCSEIGESALVAPYRREDVILVACPMGNEQVDRWVAADGARLVATVEGYLIYASPLGPEPFATDDDLLP